MEVMNVPQSRSRISLAPSVVKGGRVRGRKSKGEGVFDVLKTVGKAVAPVAIDLASNYAKDRIAGSGFMDGLKSVGKAVAPVVIDLASDYAKKQLNGGMALPVMMSGGQIRSLKRGGAVTLKPSMVSDEASHALAMLPATAKKVMNALSKNKGIRVALKQGEDLIHRQTGQGLFDVLKTVGKAVAPVAIDLASNYAKDKIAGSGTKKGMMRRTARKAYEGDGIFDVLKTVGKAVAPVAIDLASNYAKDRIAGGAMMGMRNRKKRVMGAGGSPYVSMPYRQTMSNYGSEEGGSIYPAGGSIYPAGSGGSIYPAGAMSGRGVDMPIQLGSPYQQVGSPAMSPFIPTHSQLSGYNPIKSKMKGGEGVIGSTIGQILGSMLPI
jgi:hypothetical protein